MTADPIFVAECACGQVRFEGVGRPMITLACYCDDCQRAAQQIEALPAGRSGQLADGGTVSAIFRRERVRCVRGERLLIEHKLSARTPTRRVLTSCCHCSMTARFDNWFPHVPLRSHAAAAVALRPEVCIFTKFAPDRAAIVHAAPQHGTLSAGFAWRLAQATAANVARALWPG